MTLLLDVVVPTGNEPQIATPTTVELSAGRCSTNASPDESDRCVPGMAVMLEV